MNFKNGEDFIDLEITYMSLFGYFLGGQYRPVFSITSDPPDKIKRRILVVRQIIDSLNKDIFSHLGSKVDLRMKYTLGTVLAVNNKLDALELIHPGQI